MKKIKSLLLPYFLVIICISCNKTTEYTYVKDKWNVHKTNKLLYDKAFVHYRVNLKNEFHPQWQADFKGADFIGGVFKDVFKRKNIVFDPKYDILDSAIKIEPLAINERLGYQNDTIVRTDEIHSIGFNEHWFYDPDSFVFAKEVQKWFPVRHFFNKDDSTKSNEQLKKVFSIRCSDADLEKFNTTNTSKYKSIAKNLRVEFSYKPDNYQDYQGIDFQSFVNSISDKVLNGQIQVYDPTYVDNLKLVSFKPTDVKEKLAEILTSYRFEISSLIFDEDWFYDQASMKIEKSVNGVVFVREFYKEDTDDFKTKKVLFYVQFNKRKPV